LRICSFVSKEYMNVTDGQTDRQTPHNGIGRAYDSIVQQLALVLTQIYIGYTENYAKQTSATSSYLLWF